MKFILSLLALMALQLLPAHQATAGEWWEPAMKSAQAPAASNRSARSSRQASAPRAERAPRAAAPSYNGGGESGVASYYWQPQRTASGGWFNPNAMTAAHKTLPLGTRVRVTRADTGQSVDVTINDRGPYVAGRVIDLSRAAAQSINMTGRGLAPVSVSVLGR